MEQYKNNKKIILIVILITTLLLGIFIWIHRKSNSTPTFPDSSESTKLVNQYLKNLTTSLKEKNLEFYSEMSKNKKVTSLIVEIDQLSSDSEYIIPKFVAFSVDNVTKKVLSKEEILSLYGYQISDVEDAIKQRFQQFYQEEAELGYVDSNECTFENYLIFYRNISSFDEIYEIYVKNDKINIYFSFDKNSIVEDIDYFNNLNYNLYKIEL